MYVQDYDEKFPQNDPVAYTDPLGPQLRGEWTGWISNLVYPYTKNSQIFLCPSSPGGGWTDWRDNLTVGYCYNYVSFYGTKLASVPAPAQAIMMWDSANPWADGYGPIWTRDIAWFLTQNDAGTCWHNGQNNYLYADGHVKSSSWGGFTWDQIWVTQVKQGHPDFGKPVTTAMAQPPY
jgi:prepilin-type processing-associated H-X9-DG protein